MKNNKQKLLIISNLLVLALALPILPSRSLAGSDSVINVSEGSTMVYYHPTPKLEVSVIDLGDQGGSVNLSLEYDSQSIASEEAKLRLDYPGYEIKALMAKVRNSQLKLDIPEIDVHQVVPLRQGQLGPYLNLQLSLSVAQMKSIRAAKGQLGSLSKMSIEVQVNYTSNKIYERYENNGEVCKGFDGITIRDLIVKMHKWNQPPGIKFAQTFENYKQHLIKECFEIRTISAGSLTEVLDLPLRSIIPAKPIVGSFSERREEVLNFLIRPDLKISLN